MGQIVVVRHGQASILGPSYDELSELGHRQGVRLGEFWSAAGVSFDRAFSGPAKRHIGTAANAGYADAEVLPELDEHDAFTLIAQAIPALQDDPEVAELAQTYGTAPKAERSRTFQRLFEVVMRRWMERDFAGVEPFAVFRDRVLAGLRRLVEASRDGKRVVAFSSVGPVAVMLGRVLELPPERAFETGWRLRNCGITSFVHGRGRFTLDRFNALPHLPDPKTHTFR